jgi:RNA polymerase primary sigma factor
MNAIQTHQADALQTQRSTNPSDAQTTLAPGQTYRTSPQTLALPRARLMTPRLPRRSRAAAVSESRAHLPAPVPAAPEVIPAESPRGDALQLYLREVGQVKLLTPKEEVALARRIKRGDKQAREQMIKANLRLVVKIAREYESLGLPLLDLINEGNIGLMKGVERFDPAKGAKLSTYSSWWIKQSIKRALANQSKTIRLPVHVVDKVAHIRKAEMRLREALGREPTDEEVADELGLNARRVRQYRDASRAPVSLDSPIGDGDSTSISEIVVDANAAAPFDRLVTANDTALVHETLATLDARENKVLAMRFGLDDGEPKTLEEVGEHFGLTRERIRQIQEQALLKMRVKIETQDLPAAKDCVLRDSAPD